MDISADLRICISATLNRCLHILKKMLSKICYVQMDQTLHKKWSFPLKSASHLLKESWIDNSIFRAVKSVNISISTVTGRVSWQFMTKNFITFEFQIIESRITMNSWA